ncbi:hypothetical protein B0A50_01922 [Salinomyces thailandicus]|uniref:C2 NT-type domain-containing protein n=1 Tax=Salinomyces thailandicus TaxID=706561 RepID=A0A4U0U7E5_9PEZI|nr:hypothetical protein B0A50_01922 [Salinomyces thailandica]
MPRRCVWSTCVADALFAGAPPEAAPWRQLLGNRPGNVGNYPRLSKATSSASPHLCISNPPDYERQNLFIATPLAYAEGSGDIPTMSSAFVSKSRRVRFQLTLHVLDLNNVPLVSGTSFIKWHLPSSTAAEHRGRTPKCAIKDHRVVFDYSKSIPVRLTVGKDGMLQETAIHFEVCQEYSSGGRAERITLGNVKCNLAEYVEASEQIGSPQASSPAGQPRESGDGGELGVVRRYLMQESKINSTLKVGIYMRYIDGTRDYNAPPLRSAPVFGGIAGILHSSEPVSTAHVAAAANDSDQQAAQDPDSGAMPSLSSANRELGEMQDMYRRTLAAYWASQPGEMRADECIEDIFSGGDGWGHSGRPPPVGNPDASSATGSGTSTPNPDGDGAGVHSSRGSDLRHQQGAKAGRRMGNMGHRYGKSGHKMRVPRKGAGELDEFEVREDLRSWTVGERAMA